MGQLKKGDLVKHISGNPKQVMTVVKVEGDRVLCKWETNELDNAEGLFLAEKLRKIQKPT